jgi:hypothetical protein
LIGIFSGKLVRNIFRNALEYFPEKTSLFYFYKYASNCDFHLLLEHDKTQQGYNNVTIFYIIKITPAGLAPTTLSYYLFAWKLRPVLEKRKERRGFTEHLGSCPEYSEYFLNVKEILPLNFLRRIS